MYNALPCSNGQSLAFLYVHEAGCDVQEPWACRGCCGSRGRRGRDTGVSPAAGLCSQDPLVLVFREGVQILRDCILCEEKGSNCKPIILAGQASNAETYPFWKVQYSCKFVML